MKGHINKLPPVSELRRLFRLDRRTNRLFHRARTDLDAPHSARWAGKPVGNRGQRYINVRINLGGRRLFLQLHRIIWKMRTGRDPLHIDHKNGDGFDNSKRNIRNATRAQNMRNARRWRGKTVPKGVHQRKENGRFRAYICVDRHLIHLGTYDTAEQAAAVYAAASRKYHGRFGNLG